MSSGTNVTQLFRERSVTVSFAERFAASDQFDSIFRSGMGLVERTATYLDGEGRRDAKALSPGLALIYATESMRLTTRLLELASWLLLRRSMKEGEVTAEEARVKRRTIRLSPIARPSHVKGFAELPRGLRALIEESTRLNDRVLQLDRALQGTPADGTTTADPVGAAIAELKAAFAAKGCN